MVAERSAARRPGTGSGLQASSSTLGTVRPGQHVHGVKQRPHRFWSILACRQDDAPARRVLGSVVGNLDGRGATVDGVLARRGWWQVDVGHLRREVVQVVGVGGCQLAVGSDFAVLGDPQLAVIDGEDAVAVQHSAGDADGQAHALSVPASRHPAVEHLVDLSAVAACLAGGEEGEIGVVQGLAGVVVVAARHEEVQ